MRGCAGLLTFLFLLIATGCSKTAPQSTTAGPAASSPTQSVTPANGADQSSSSSAASTVSTTQGKVNVCDLLTSKDLQTIQGEALKETKPSARSEGGFMISQCFFSLPTYTNSISLLVAQRGESAGARDPKEFWEETFNRAGEVEQERAKEKEREREKNKDQNKENDKAEAREEKEGTVPPQRIQGLGNDAYWTGNRVGGALYALKGNTYIRISVGGPGDQAAKIKKAKALAQIILKRL